MPGFLLHQGAVVMCLHGGQAMPHRAQSLRSLVMGMPTATITVPWVVAGCPGIPPAVPPCVTGQWLLGTLRVTSYRPAAGGAVGHGHHRSRRGDADAGVHANARYGDVRQTCQHESRLSLRIRLHRPHRAVAVRGAARGRHDRADPVHVAGRTREPPHLRQRHGAAGLRAQQRCARRGAAAGHPVRTPAVALRSDSRAVGRR